MYFECYEWVNIISVIVLFLIGEGPTKSGSININLVEYNAEEKNIAVELYQKGE